MALKTKLLIVSFCMLFVTINCSNNGMFLGMNQTNVELSDANYEIVATNLVGKSQAGYLLGFSWSFGYSAQTLALALPARDARAGYLAAGILGSWLRPAFRGGETGIRNPADPGR